METSVFHFPGQTDSAIFASVNHQPRGDTSQGNFEQWVVGLTLAGHCRWRQGKTGEIDLAPGTVWIGQPRHDIRWQSSTEGDTWRCAFAVFRPRTHWLPWLNAHVYTDGMTSFVLQGAVLSRVKREMLSVCRKYERQSLHRDEWSQLALERVLLSLYDYISRSNSTLDPRVAKAVHHMLVNIGEPLDLQDIARCAFVSGSLISQLFNSQLGMPPMRYLENLRMERAKEMLTFTPTSITRIAALLGYNDAEYFSRRFRQHTGLTPREYRKTGSG